MNTILIVISSALALVSYVVYIIAILKGKAKPHRTTRFVLVVITVLTTASLFFQNNSVALWLSASMAFGCIFVFILSIKFGMGGAAKTDIICLVVSLVGIALWKLTRNPSLALYASVTADFVSQVPMLIKTYRFPKTEVWTFYALDVIAAILSLLAINQWTVPNLIFPAYIVLIDSTTILFILRPLSLKSSEKI